MQTASASEAKLTHEKGCRLTQAIDMASALKVSCSSLGAERRYSFEQWEGCLSVRRARTREMIARFVEKLSVSLSSKLKTSVEIRVPQNQNKYSKAADVVNFALGSFVTVHLKVFQETICLMLPFELVHDIVANVLGRPHDGILTTPNTEDLTALSYFVVHVISGQGLLNNHRVYLLSVSLCLASDGEQKEKFKEEVGQELNKKGGLVYTTELVVKGYVHPVLVLLTKPLVKRIATYGKHQALNITSKGYISKFKIKTSFEFQYDLRSIVSLLEIKPGIRLSFRSTRDEESGIWPALLKYEQGELAMVIDRVSSTSRLRVIKR